MASSRERRLRIPASVREALKENGFEFVGQGKHIKFRHAGTGRVVSMSLTASCVRAERNILADIRKIVEGDIEHGR